MKRNKEIKVFSALLITVLAFSMAACEKNEKATTDLANLKVSNIVSSDCLLHNESNNNTKGLYNPDSMTVSYNNGTIYITHYNATVNCGFEKVNVHATISGDTIKITERSYPDDANCLCEIENSFEINNVPHGTYVILLENWEPAPYCQTFNF